MSYGSRRIERSIQLNWSSFSPIHDFIRADATHIEDVDPRGVADHDWRVRTRASVPQRNGVRVLPIDVSMGRSRFRLVEPRWILAGGSGRSHRTTRQSRRIRSDRESARAAMDSYYSVCSVGRGLRRDRGRTVFHIVGFQLRSSIPGRALSVVRERNRGGVGSSGGHSSRRANVVAI